MTIVSIGFNIAQTSKFEGRNNYDLEISGHVISLGFQGLEVRRRERTST